nr:MAG TPA_asm: hypothetical protein [Bacteriophage sp.]DAL27975.1 MAG TPA_asm: hypothetical protein [Caudoviricetes sp.]
MMLIAAGQSFRRLLLKKGVITWQNLPIAIS